MQIGTFICDNCGWTTEFDSIKRGSRNNVFTPEITTEPVVPEPINKDIMASKILPTRGGCCGGTAPSIFQKARNLATTMGDFANSGFKVADEEVYNKRMEICRGCDRFENNRFCKECGCFMDLKAKIEVAECPLDKWPK